MTDMFTLASIVPICLYFQYYPSLLLMLIPSLMEKGNTDWALDCIILRKKKLSSFCLIECIILHRKLSKLQEEKQSNWSRNICYLNIWCLFILVMHGLVIIFSLLYAWHCLEDPNCHAMPHSIGSFMCGFRRQRMILVLAAKPMHLVWCDKIKYSFILLSFNLITITVELLEQTFNYLS